MHHRPTTLLFLFFGLLLLSACDLQKESPTGPAPIVTIAGAPATGKGGVSGSSVPTSAWTSEQWQDWFFQLVEHRNLPTFSGDAMAALRPTLNQVGADWQNGWRGDYRGRIYLPTPDCPPPTTADAPGCSYARAVDVGEHGHGQPWTWIPRF